MLCPPPPPSYSISTLLALRFVPPADVSSKTDKRDWYGYVVSLGIFGALLLTTLAENLYFDSTCGTWTWVYLRLPPPLPLPTAASSSANPLGSCAHPYMAWLCCAVYLHLSHFYCDRVGGCGCGCGGGCLYSGGEDGYQGAISPGRLHLPQEPSTEQQSPPGAVHGRCVAHSTAHCTCQPVGMPPTRTVPPCVAALACVLRPRVSSCM
jgi:hypothetical protein